MTIDPETDTMDTTQTLGAVVVLLHQAAMSAAAWADAEGPNSPGHLWTAEVHAAWFAAADLLLNHVDLDAVSTADGLVTCGVVGPHAGGPAELLRAAERLLRQVPIHLGSAGVSQVVVAVSDVIRNAPR